MNPDCGTLGQDSFGVCTDPTDVGILVHWEGVWGRHAGINPGRGSTCMVRGGAKIWNPGMQGWGNVTPSGGGLTQFAIGGRPAGVKQAGWTGARGSVTSFSNTGWSIGV